MSGWPRLSETFALNELLALDRRSMLAAVFGTKAGDDAIVHPATARLGAPVHILSPGEPAEQGAEVAALLAAMGPAGEVRGVHGYFAHTPTAVACAAAGVLGVPYGFSVHALDARKVDADTLAEQARDAAVTIACNPDVAATLRCAGALARLLPHGVDLDHFRPVASVARQARRDAAAEPTGQRLRLATGGRDHEAGPPEPDRALELLAVGRFVAKKGFDVLLEAVARLDGDVKLRLVGDGPLRDDLTARARALGLDDRVDFVGRRTHAQLPAMYRSADVVVVPSVVDAAGDRDGLPNVVLEAMACGCAIVASDVAAIATAVTDGRTGLLVAPGQPDELAAALAHLGADPASRHRLGTAARERVEQDFELGTCAGTFCDVLEESYAR
ncbi:MAG: glycosyltransferase [Acidimicrobiia bacterium]|nr:glycosyltransferase [Acidimicrobiia bacterium]